MTMISLPRLGAAMLACVLASCGGGGGGGDGGGGSSPLTVTSSGSAFTSIGLAPSPPQTQSVQFTLHGGQGGYFVAAFTDDPEFTAPLTILSDTTAAVTLSPGVSIDQGMHRSGQVTFQVCTDDQCAHVAWTHSYPFSYTQYRVDATPLTLTGTEGEANAPITLSVTPADTVGALSFQPDAAWLAAAHDANGNLTLTASGVGLPAGSYSGGTTVALVQNPNVNLVLPVSLTLGSGIVAPALSEIVVQRSTPSAGLQGSAPVAFNGGRSAAWTAQSDQPWLVVDTSSGSGPGTLQYHVDPAAAAAAVPNWDAGTASLAISAPGFTTVHAPLTLRRQLPEIAMLSPSQVLPGQAATLSLSGRGLSQVGSIDQILVDGQPVASGSVLSDTRAVVQMAAHAAGSLQVSVANASGMPSGEANVAVANGLSTYSVVLSPANDSKNAIVYDPSRKAVFAASYYGGTLQRFKRDAGGWVLTTKPWSGLWRLQMSPDRRTLYVLDVNGLSEVDPDTLVEVARHAPPLGTSYFQGFYFDVAMPLTSDLRMWLPLGGQYFDLRSGSFQWYGRNVNVGFDNLTATPDGEHLYSTEGTYQPAPPNGWYSAATQTVSPLPGSLLNFNYRASFDTQGTVGVFEGDSVYRTADWSLVGHARAPASDSAYPMAQMSPDGQRAYVLALSNATGLVDHINVFDTTQLQPGTSNLVLLGNIPVPDPAAQCHGEYECDVTGRLTIDPIGATLFWAGNHGLVVIPIPDALSGRAAALRAPRRGLGLSISAATPAPR